MIDVLNVGDRVLLCLTLDTEVINSPSPQDDMAFIDTADCMVGVGMGGGGLWRSPGGRWVGRTVLDLRQFDRLLIFNNRHKN